MSFVKCFTPKSDKQKIMSNRFIDISLFRGKINKNHRDGETISCFLNLENRPLSFFLKTPFSKKSENISVGFFKGVCLISDEFSGHFV